MVRKKFSEIFNSNCYTFNEVVYSNVKFIKDLDSNRKLGGLYLI